VRAAALVMGVALSCGWRRLIRRAGALTPFGASSEQGGGQMMAALVPFYSHALPQRWDYVRILPEIVLSSLDGAWLWRMEPLLDDADRAEGSGIELHWWGRWRELGRRGSWRRLPGLAFWNMVRVDGFSVFFMFW